MGWDGITPDHVRTDLRFLFRPRCNFAPQEFYAVEHIVALTARSCTAKVTERLVTANLQVTMAREIRDGAKGQGWSESLGMERKEQRLSRFVLQV